MTKKLMFKILKIQTLILLLLAYRYCVKPDSDSKIVQVKPDIDVNYHTGQPLATSNIKK